MKPREGGARGGKKGGMDPVVDARGRGFDAAIAQGRYGRRKEVVSGAERAEKGDRRDAQRRRGERAQRLTRTRARFTLRSFR